MFFLEYELYRVSAQFWFFCSPIFGAVAGGLSLGPIGAILGLGGGIFVGSRMATLIFKVYVARAKECYIAGRTTEQLLEELRGPEPKIPWVLLEELKKRGQLLLPELSIVHTLLVSTDPNKRDAGWQALEAGFPELHRDIVAAGAGKPPEDCSAVVRFLEEFQAQLHLPPITHSSSGTPS